MTTSITFGSGITIGSGITSGTAGGGGGGGVTVFEMGTWASGTTMPDISGNGNNFTLSNVSAGETPYAFDGTYATANNNNFPTVGATAMTLRGWFRLPSFSAGSISLISRNSGGTGWAMRIDSNGNQINLVKYNVADQRITLSTTLTANAWHFIAVSQTASSLVFVVDGATYTASGSATPFAGSGIPVRLAFDQYIGGVQPAQDMERVVILDNEAQNSTTLTGFWNAQKASYGY